MTQESQEQFNRRTLLKYGGAVTVGTIFAGCSGNTSTNNGNGSQANGGSDGYGSGTDTNGSTGTDTNGSTGTDANGSTGNTPGTDFVYVTAQTPSSIDPMKASDEFEAIIVHNMYDPLLYYNQGAPPEYIPWIAKDWTVNDDNKTYTFNLREDVAFHSGNELTADDVVYSFRRMLRMKQGFAYMWDGIVKPENITKSDKYTVKVRTNNVFAPFPATLPYMFIVDKKQVQKNTKDSGKYGKHGDYGTEWLENNVAGSGPYKLQTRNRKTSIKLTKNNQWWNNFADGNIYEKVNLNMIEEVSTMVGMMREGDADMAEQWLPLKAYNKLAQQQDIKVNAKATFQPMYVFMHNQRKPFDDINVRKAMSYAFGYKTMINEVMGGESKKLKGPLPSAMWGHNSNITPYEKNLDKAKSLIDKSKYSADEIDFTYMYVSGITARKNLGLLLQTNLNKIGVNMSIEKNPWSKIVSMHTKKETSPDMIPTTLSFSYADPDTFLYPAWHSSSHGSWQSGSWYENQKVDELLTQARQTLEKEQRASLYKEAQKIINQDAAAIFAINKATRWAHNTRLQGFEDNGVTGYIHTYHRFHEKA